MTMMGRPKHHSTEDIKTIINNYVLYTGGTVLLNASRIAEYAEKELNIKNFRYYSINRNPETKQYVVDLNKQMSGKVEKKITSAVTTFTQINVHSYQSMNEEELGKALTNLNILMEDMADSNTKLLNGNLEKDVQIKRLNDQVDELARKSAEEISQLETKIKKQRQIISKLTESVRQSKDVFHLLWDEEAEVIMKKTGVFDDDGSDANPQRSITDLKEGVIPVVKDAIRLEPEKRSDKVSHKFMERLKNI